jgi:glutathione S-transferase
MRVLYHTALSPTCRKIRIILAEKGLSFNLQAENPWERRTDFYRLNPAGEVPVLVEENQQVVVGHYAIAEYLEEKYPSPNLIGKSLADKAEIRRLMDWLDGLFYQESTQVLLWEKVYRRFSRQGSPDTRLLRESKQQMESHLQYLNHLVEQQPWLAGDSMTLADITAGAHLSSLDYLGDVPWHKIPAVREWYAILKSRSSFRAILADRVTGIIPPEQYENPDF